jgi:hypothetical protein
MLCNNMPSPRPVHVRTQELDSLRAALSPSASTAPQATADQLAQLHTAQQEAARLQVGCGASNRHLLPGVPQQPVWLRLRDAVPDCCRGGMQAQGLVQQQHEAQGESAQLAEAWAAAAAAEADRDRAKAQLARCSAQFVPFAARASDTHNIEATAVTTAVL